MKTSIRIKILRHKIPPLIVTLIFGLVIYFSKTCFPSIRFNYESLTGIGLIILGLTVIITAVSSFRKNQTTVNPLKPDAASKLVTEGVFKFSRNPMYLGLLIILIGISVQFNLIGGLIFLSIFIFYMNYFQIIPEEGAMTELFKEDFINYKNKVRRWI